MWGSSAPAFAAVERGLERDCARRRRSMCPRKLRADNPDVARWRPSIAAAGRRGSGEGESMPDVTAAGGVRRFEQTDDAAFVVGLVVPAAPVQPPTRVASRRRRQSRQGAPAQYEAIESNVEALAEATMARDAAHEEWRH